MIETKERCTHMRHGPHTLTMQQFESVTEWFRHCESVPTPHSFPMDFMGQNNVRECVRYCEENLGESHMRSARELVDKIDASFRDRERTTWRASPHGAYAIVPEYLANEPFNMRQKAREIDDRAPIRYFIETGVSGGVDVRQMEKRAAGIAALIMRSAEERPVELYVFSSDFLNGKSVIIIIPIVTRPIDLHSTIAAYGTREFQRGMVFANVKRIAGDTGGVIDWFYAHPTGSHAAQREEVLRSHLRMEPQDVLMQGGYLTDATLFERDPVAWVHTQIEKQRRIEE